MHWKKVVLRSSLLALLVWGFVMAILFLFTSAGAMEVGRRWFLDHPWITLALLFFNPTLCIIATAVLASRDSLRQLLREEGAENRLFDYPGYFTYPGYFSMAGLLAMVYGMIFWDHGMRAIALVALGLEVFWLGIWGVWSMLTLFFASQADSQQTASPSP